MLRNLFWIIGVPVLTVLLGTLPWVQQLLTLYVVPLMPLMPPSTGVSQQGLLTLLLVVLYGAVMWLVMRRPKKLTVDEVHTIVGGQMAALSKKQESGHEHMKYAMQEMQGNVAQRLERHHDSLSGKLDSANLGYLSKLAQADPVLLEMLPALLGNLGKAIEGVEDLQKDRDGDYRSFDTMMSSMDDVERLVDLAQPVAVKLAEMDVTAVTAKVNDMAGMAQSLTVLLRDADGDYIDFSEMETSLSSFTDMATPLGKVVQFMPAGMDKDTMAARIATFGTMVDTLRPIVLDEDGDAEDFGPLKEGVDGLASLSDSLNVLMGNTRARVPSVTPLAAVPQSG